METARKSEERLSIEAEALRSDVQRQGDLLGSIQRIEASLQARSSQEKDDQGAEIERLTNWLATEKSKSAAEREKLESQVDELEMKVNLLSNDRDDALRDVLHSKRDLVEAKREALNAKTECDKIVQQAHSLRANIDRLEAQKSQSVSPALNSGSGKEEQILSLTAELEASKSDLSTVKERVATYQAIAKAHETALNELREASGRLKKDQDVEIDRLRKELSIERRGSEAKQVALDELGDELSSQRGRQETTITDHKSRLTSLTTALEKTQKDAEAAETKLASVTAEVNSHKADASAAQASRIFALICILVIHLRSKDSRSSFILRLRLLIRTTMKGSLLCMHPPEARWPKPGKKGTEKWVCGPLYRLMFQMQRWS